MSAGSLRLVHSRPFQGAVEDFAFALLLSFVGLAADFAVIASGFLLV